MPDRHVVCIYTLIEINTTLYEIPLTGATFKIVRLLRFRLLSVIRLDLRAQPPAFGRVHLPMSTIARLLTPPL
jgi:hypothetical protein